MRRTALAATNKRNHGTTRPATAPGPVYFHASFLFECFLALGSHVAVPHLPGMELAGVEAWVEQIAPRIDYLGS